MTRLMSLYRTMLALCSLTNGVHGISSEGLSFVLSVLCLYIILVFEYDSLILFLTGFGHRRHRN